MSAISGATTRSRTWLTKVPAITATFWVIKVLSTTVGETFADFLAVKVGLGPVVTDVIMMSVLAVALTIQLRTRRYTPWIYWLCVVLVSIVGTQITDLFTDTLSVPLYLSTIVFAVLLTAVFITWYCQEHTLAITSIDTLRREAFYWGAILVTFALGTAAGDLANEALSLGFRNGVLVFGGLIALAFLAYRLGANAVLTFWIAYVLTRPLGASVGDLLTQDVTLGGLGLGASLTSACFLLVIAVLVTREQILIQRHGVVDKGQGPHGGRRRDLAWAAGGLVVVMILGLALSLAQPNLSESQAAAGSTTKVKPTTPLGDLSRFNAIATAVQDKISANDLPSAKTKAKDLEVAWDDAAAGLSTRDQASWRVLDGQIDTVLTSLRASNPNQTESAAALTALINTLNTYDGV